MSLPPVKTRRSKVVKARKARAKAAEAETETGANKRATTEGRGLVKWTLSLLLLLALVVLGLLLFVYPTADGPGFGAAVEVDIDPGMTPDALAERLAEKEVVGNKRLFAFYVRVSGGTGSVVPGHHLLTDKLSPRQLMARLERKGQDRIRVTLPEGWNRFDIAKRLDSSRICTARAFLDASADPDLMKELLVDGPSFEGYLFPATYDIEADSDAKEVVRTLVKEFERRYASLEDKNQSGVKDLADSLGWGRKQIVILASMVEKEAVVDDERPIIASVFLNRLRDPAFSPKLLQCDPTAGYGCLVGTSPGCHGYAGKVNHEIVADELNAYNTYKHTGLPPGPIANPGEKSLAAAMSPSLTRYLYFVAKGGGRHTFSESYAAHSSAVHEDKATDGGP